MKALARSEVDELRATSDTFVPEDAIVPELAKGEFIRHCAECTAAQVRASLESKSGIEIFCAEGRWRDKSSHRKTFKRMAVLLDPSNGYFRETAEQCEHFDSMAVGSRD